MERNVNEWDLVVKVKYGDTLRRFGVHVSGNSVDHSMNDLKVKIVDLFKFSPDADITLTYTDSDGDLVTLVNDDELLDAVVHQQLNPLRIYVELNGNSAKNPKTNTSSTDSSHISSAVSEAFKSVPEPLGSVLSKLSQDFVSKAAISAPVFAEFVEHLTKRGPGNAFSGGPSADKGDLNGNYGQSSNNFLSEQTLLPSASFDNQTLNNKENKSETVLPRANSDVQTLNNKEQEPEIGNSSLDVGSSAAPVDLSMNRRFMESILCSNKIAENQKADAGQCIRESVTITAPPPVPLIDLEQNVDMNNFFESGHAISNFNQIDENCSADMAFVSEFACNTENSSGTSRGISASAGDVDLINSSLPIGNPHRLSNVHGEGSFRVFHRGILCDGCGMNPIMGPRYKSNVKENYDLCSTCFSQSGDKADYIRIDQPQHHCSRSLRGPFTSKMPYGCRGHGIRQSRAKLESRFIRDVTIEDGMMVPPSTPFTKIWKMSNNGSVPWPMGTRLIWIGGDQFADSSYVELEIPVNGLPAGEEIDIAVNFTTPRNFGRYVSYWRLCSPSGQKFGQRVWVLVQVLGNSSTTNHRFEFNLNLPPAGPGWNRVNVIDVTGKPREEVPSSEPYFSAVDVELTNTNSDRIPGGNLQSTPMEDLNIPSNGFTKVPEMTPMTSYPKIDSSFPLAEVSWGKAPLVSYPIVDSSQQSSTAPPGTPPSVSFPSYSIVDSLLESSFAPPGTVPLVSSPSHDSPQVSATGPVVCVDPPSKDSNNANPAEHALLKELEEMGFKEVALNKEILRMNEYDLQQSLDDLCGVGDWDPLLKELQEMGFHNTELNKKLLVKNSGSIKRVVLDLIAGEKL